MSLTEWEKRTWDAIEAGLRAELTAIFPAGSSYSASASFSASAFASVSTSASADADDRRPSAVAAFLGRVGLALVIAASAVLCAVVAVAVIVGFVALASIGPIGWPGIAVFLVFGGGALGVHQVRTVRATAR